MGITNEFGNLTVYIEAAHDGACRPHVYIFAISKLTFAELQPIVDSFPAITLP